MRDKIYIADDEFSNRELLVACIEEICPNYVGNIYAFENGQKFYEALKINHLEVSVALTDENMPVMRGLDVIKKCRKENIDTPIILMSGYELKEMAMDAGAQGFLGKPFGIDTLESVLGKYLNSSSQ